MSLHGETIASGGKKEMVTQNDVFQVFHEYLAGDWGQNATSACYFSESIITNDYM